MKWNKKIKLGRFRQELHKNYDRNVGQKQHENFAFGKSTDFKRFANAVLALSYYYWKVAVGVDISQQVIINSVSLKQGRKCPLDAPKRMIEKLSASILHMLCKREWIIGILSYPKIVFDRFPAKIKKYNCK